MNLQNLPDKKKYEIEFMVFFGVFGKLIPLFLVFNSNLKLFWDLNYRIFTGPREFRIRIEVQGDPWVHEF